jgi:hypothetical protein
MKISEFRKLIREEVRRVVNEAKPLQQGMSELLDPMIKGLYDQYDVITVTPSIVNIEISSDPHTDSVKVYNALVKNKEAIKNYLTSNNLPNAKIYLCKNSYGFGGTMEVVINSQPKLSRVFTVVKETQI